MQENSKYKFSLQKKFNKNWRQNFSIFKKPWFWTIFGPSFQILGQNFFFWKIWLSHTTSHGFQAPCQNLEKTNNTVPTKHLDRRMDSGTKRQKDRQTLFHRILPATARGPKTLESTLGITSLPISALWFAQKNASQLLIFACCYCAKEYGTGDLME